MISVKSIEEMLMDSLYTSAEVKDGDPPDAILVEGITSRFGLHPGRLESHRAEVREFVLQLDKRFFPAAGGGYTFLHLPFDKHGNQWGEQKDAERLMVLAMGLGMSKYLLPRDLWPSLPGGAPYIMFVASENGVLK